MRFATRHLTRIDSAVSTERLSMSSVQVLIDQKAALENEIARTIKLAEEKKKLLEEQIATQRAEEIAQGRAEIERVMKKYNLSSNEAFGPMPTAAKKPGGSVTPRGSYLSEIRQYYSGRLA